MTSLEQEGFAPTLNHGALYTCAFAPGDVMTPAPNSQSQIRLVGLEADGGLARLNDFASLCQSLQQCLKEVERSIAQRDPSLQFRITELACESAHLAIEPISTNGIGSEVIGVFNSTAERLEQGGAVDQRLSIRALECFRDLYRPVWKNREQNARLLIGRTELSTDFLTHVNALLEAPLRSLGSVSGRLEKVNVHAKFNQFVIFPPVGDFHVACSFPDDLMDQVRSGLDRHVTVSGVLHYARDRTHPSKAEVHEIEIHPSDDDLPRLSDMRGILGNGGGDNSVDSIRALRNEWE